MRIGVAGTGKLGSAVAERLLSRGFSVGVWNRTSGKHLGLREMGATAHDTPAALALASDVVLSFLIDDQALDAAFGGADGLLSTGRAHRFIEMSTLPPKAHMAMAARAIAAGSTYLECPVVGSRDAALSGTLVGLAGGEQADFDAARPVLNALCRRAEHLGPIGSAASVKLAVNLPLIVYFEVLAEALRLVDHLHLDPDLMISLLADSVGGPALLRIKGGTIADALAGRPMAPAQSTVATFLKDLRIMREEASTRGVELPATDAAFAAYRQLEAAHAGDIDSMALPALLLASGRSN